MFVIEDESHAEWQGEFESLPDAINELKRRARISWDQPPNGAPCMSWKTCGRRYVVIEFDNSTTPWTELRRLPALEVSAAGVRWSADIEEMLE